jgi:hypothetical protein
MTTPECVRLAQSFTGSFTIENALYTMRSTSILLAALVEKLG